MRVFSFSLTLQRAQDFNSMRQWEQLRKSGQIIENYYFYLKRRRAIFSSPFMIMDFATTSRLFVFKGLARCSNLIHVQEVKTRSSDVIRWSMSVGCEAFRASRLFTDPQSAECWLTLANHCPPRGDRQTPRAVNRSALIVLCIVVILHWYFPLFLLPSGFFLFCMISVIISINQLLIITRYSIRPACTGKY